LSEIIETLKKCNHKPGIDINDWDIVHPNLLLLAQFYLEFCTKYKLPLTFTSIIRPKIVGVSETDIHAEKRAFDTSSKGFTVDDIDSLLIDCNKEFASKIGAYKSMDGHLVPRAVIYEHNQGSCILPTRGIEYAKLNENAFPHFHFQVRA